MKSETSRNGVVAFVIFETLPDLYTAFLGYSINLNLK